jgi:hypothetical protein
MYREDEKRDHDPYDPVESRFPAIPTKISCQAFEWALQDILSQANP